MTELCWQALQRAAQLPHCQAIVLQVDPVVYNMLQEDPGKVDYSMIGGLGEQIREIRESIELPLLNPELFLRVGIKPPKGVLLYGPPGTGKTLLARAIASNIDANFLKVNGPMCACCLLGIGEYLRIDEECMLSLLLSHGVCGPCRALIGLTCVPTSWHARSLQTTMQL